MEPDVEDLHQQIADTLAVAVQWEDKCETLQEEINLINDVMYDKDQDIQVLHDKLAENNKIIQELEKNNHDLSSKPYGTFEERVTEIVEPVYRAQSMQPQFTSTPVARDNRLTHNSNLMSSPVQGQQDGFVTAGSVQSSVYGTPLGSENQTEYQSYGGEYGEHTTVFGTPMAGDADTQRGVDELQIDKLQHMLHEKEGEKHKITTEFEQLKKTADEEKKDLLAKVSKLKTLLKAKSSKIAKLEGKASVSDKEDLGSSQTVQPENDIPNSHVNVDHHNTIEVDNLKALISEKESHLCNLQGEIVSLQSQLSAKETEITQLKYQIEGYSEWHINETAGLQSSITELQTAVTEKDALLVQWQQYNDNVQSQIAYLLPFESKCLELENNMQPLQQNLTALESEKEQLQTQLDLLNGELEKEKLEFKSKEDSFSDNDEMFRQMEVRCKELEEQLTAKHDEIITKDQEVASLTDDITHIKQSNMEVTKMLHSQISGIDEERLQLKTSLEEVVQQCREKDQWLEVLDKQNKSLTERTKNLEHTLKDMENTFRENLQCIEARDYQIETLQNSLHTSQSTGGLSDSIVHERDATIQDLQQQIVHLRENLHQQGSEMQDVQMLYSTQGERLEEALEALEETSQSHVLKMEERNFKIQELEQAVHSSKEECDTLSEKLSNRETLVQELKDIILNLESSKQTLSAALLEKDSIISQFEERSLDTEEKLRKQMDTSREMQMMYNDQMERQSNMVQTMEEFTENNNKRLQEKEETIVALMKQVAALESHQHDLQSRLDYTLNNAGDSQAQLQELSNQTLHLQQSLTDSINSTQEKDQVIASLHEEMNALNSSAQSNAQIVNIMEVEMGRLRNEASEMGRLRNEASEMGRLRNEASEMQQTLQDKNLDILTLQNDCDQKTELIKQLEDQLTQEKMLFSPVQKENVVPTRSADSSFSPIEPVVTSVTKAPSYQSQPLTQDNVGQLASYFGGDNTLPSEGRGDNTLQSEGSLDWDNQTSDLDQFIVQTEHQASEAITPQQPEESTNQNDLFSTKRIDDQASVLDVSFYTLVFYIVYL